MRNPHLHFGLYNTSVATVPKEMFDHAEYVRNVTIDVHENELKTLENPIRGYKPAVPGKRFLLRLKMARSNINCNCDIGWIEMWQRKHRQYQEDRCSSYGEYSNFEMEGGDAEFSCWDNGWDDDLRQTYCANKNNMTVAEALKKDIECGWGAASAMQSFSAFAMLLVAIVASFC